VVLCLASPDDETASASRMRVLGGDRMAASISFEPNSVVAVCDPLSAYADVVANPAAVGCTYEFPIGPDGESRRRLTILAEQRR
jgi:hypothetical protein